MKRISALIVLTACIMCGCMQSYQIDDLVFAKIIGIDYSDGKVTVTAGVRDSSKNSEVEKTVSVCADTVAQGINELSQRAPKRVFLGQVSIILLGEGCAENGIIPAVDYFIRAAEMRFDLPVLIAKEKTAKDAIEESGGEEPLSEKIENLLKYADTVSSSGTVKLSRLVEMTEDPFEAVYLPYLTFGDEILLEGYGVFNGSRIEKYFSAEESRGINFIANTFGDWVFPLEINGDIMTVMISDGNTKIELMQNGVFSIDIKFKTTVLQSENGSTDTENSEIKEIIEKECTTVKELVLSTLDKLKSIPADPGGCFGLTYYRAAGKKAYEQSENWQNDFAGIKCEVNVTAETDMSKTQQAHVKGN